MKIIEILMQNARIPKTEIAKRLGITETAVRKRIAKLEGVVILGYKAIINYKSAGLASSLTGVDVHAEKLWEVVDKFKGINEIKSIWLTTGDHTIMLEIVAKSVKDLQIVHDMISKMDGVKRVCPSIILDVLK